MDINASCPLASELADLIKRDRRELTQRWLERIAARVSLEPNRIFPSDELLDHVPVLLEGIADYIANPAEEITADMPVIAKAMELGALRLKQGFGAHEILKEYEILGGVLFNHVADHFDEMKMAGPGSDLLLFSHRLFRAISVIEQATTGHYLQVSADRVNEREERLRRFNRMVSHELKNNIGAVLGAGELLQEEWLPADQQKKFIGIIMENGRAVQKVLQNLTELSRLDPDSRRQRNVMLREAVAEVVRQQRELARAHGVAIEVEDLPLVEVHAAALELCLSNYISNAVKYSNRSAPERWVRVSGSLGVEGEKDCELVVTVEDNGLGVPEEQRSRLFERFFRSEATASAIEGTGLGLSLVREAVEAIGGRAWAEFEDGRTRFIIAMPCRRRAERVQRQIREAPSPARG